MHYACGSGNFGLVQKLFMRGLSLIKPDNNGMKPIHFAAKGESVETLEFLHNEGANINEVVNNESPLTIAVNNNRPENVAFLLENGANVKDGTELLIFSAKEGHDEVIKALIEKGNLEPDQVDSLGWSPLLHAAENCHLSTCKVLIEHGSDVNLTSKFGFTATHAAMNKNYEELKDYLISIGGKINTKVITSDELSSLLQ